MFSKDYENIEKMYHLSKETIDHFNIEIDTILENLTFNNSSKEKVFNVSALKNRKINDLVFIVETKLDVATLYEIGIDAISINKDDIFSLVSKMEKLKNKPVLLIDNTFADEKNERIKKIFEENNIKFSFVKIKKTENYFEDLNDFFKTDMNGFIDSVATLKKEFKLYIDKERQREFFEEYKTADLYIDELLEDLNSKKDKHISTGFNGLDDILGGGLYDGLYILGSGSSNGKTTFVMQIGDYIASQGKDVLIFSLEMSRAELMQKSISRLTFLQSKTHPVSVLEIVGSFVKGSEYERVFNNAVNEYKSYSNKILIVESVGEIGALQIKNTIQDYINFKGTLPVVIIDYLQILAPYSKEYTRDLRASIDKTLVELKRITRQFKIPIIAISSFNRTAYFKGETGLDAFKESGCIEYSSDVLIGLDFVKPICSQEALDNEKNKHPREMKVIVLKNRRGKLGKPIICDYYPKYHYFSEVSEIKKLN